MPWDSNEALLKSIPSLKALPSAALSLFRSVANKQIGKGDLESTAIKIAWGVVKKRFKKKGDVWVARTEEFEDVQYYSFEAVKSEEFITRTDDGVELHNYVLSDTLPDDLGTSPTEELLTEWASWINENQPEADTDHQIMEEAQKLYGGDAEKVTKMVRSKKGIAKAIKAFVDKGQLIVSLAFDKRYHNYVDKVKGLSIEASVIKDTLTNKFKKGNFLGLTMAVNKNPANRRSVRL